MRVLIIDHPWKKTWLPIYAKSINKLGHEVGVWDGRSNVKIPTPDVVLCTWADRDFTDLFPKARHVLMMRRFEYFHSPWLRHNWDRISALICCNPWIANQMRQGISGHKTDIYYIPNPIDASLWTYKERGHGNKIGMVGRIHPVKNYPLAAQILMALPDDYELHIAGETNDSSVEAYLRGLGLKNLFLHGPIPNRILDEWWEDKNYCLSTAISEGDPMFVLEAMAKGIKPIIHWWPGADEQYPGFTIFQAIRDAVDCIESDTIQYTCHSKRYREFVEQKRGVGLADKVAKIIVGDEAPSL